MDRALLRWNRTPPSRRAAARFGSASRTRRPLAPRPRTASQARLALFCGVQTQKHIS